MDRNLNISYSPGRFFRIILLSAFLLFPFADAFCEEAKILTVWPLADYRRSPDVDYASLNLLGPIIKYERKGREREFSLRPLYFRAWDENASYTEFLYPVASNKTEPGHTFFQGLHLLNYDFGSRTKGSDNEFMLFPFVFYGKTEERGSYFALFPAGGKIYDKFGRDEMRFALFPLYGWTRKDDRTITNIVWPVFARIRGNNESGLKFWPLYGDSRKKGVYRKTFYLWPIGFRYDTGLNTENPTYLRTVFPFFVGKESPQESSRTYLWPFFSHTENRRKDYEEWNFPWPLFRITHGTDKEGKRFLPFYADERSRDQRKRWFLWPVYKIEETHSETLNRRRDRILYFLYSDLEETMFDEPGPRKKRVALWPLFTYEQIKGVSHFHTLSLLEPFFPEKDGFERNWSPLWRLYQRKWDKHGNEISSLLWNLYWKERRGPDLVMEFFPFFFYKRETGRGTDFKLLKGLVRYRDDKVGKKLNLFYLPWAVPMGHKDE
jgi:hypothetical protein